jgi:hypothetical protein
VVAPRRTRASIDIEALGGQSNMLIVSMTGTAGSWRRHNLRERSSPAVQSNQAYGESGVGVAARLRRL